jgi:hypothetical protein
MVSIATILLVRKLEIDANKAEQIELIHRERESHSLV